MDSLSKLNTEILNSWKVIESFEKSNSNFDIIEKVKFEDLTLKIYGKETIIPENPRKKIDLNEYFKNLPNVFNNILPTDEYFDLSSIFTNWEDLLKKEKLDLILEEWVCSLNKLHSKILDIQQNLKHVPHRKEDLYKYLEIENEYICRERQNCCEIFFYKSNQSFLKNFAFELNFIQNSHNFYDSEVLVILKKHFVKVVKKMEILKIDDSLEINSHTLMKIIGNKIVIIDLKKIHIFNAHDEKFDLEKSLDINIPHDYLNSIYEYEGNLIITSTKYNEKLSTSPRFMCYLSLWNVKEGFLVKKIEKIARIIKVTCHNEKVIMGVCDTKPGSNDEYEVISYDLPNLSFLNYQKSVGQINCFLTIQNKILVSGGYDDFISLWNMKDGILIKRLPIPKGFNNRHQVFCLEYFQLKNRLIAGNFEGFILGFDLDTYSITNSFQAHKSGVYCTKIYENKKLVTGSWDMTIKIWELENENCIFTISPPQKGSGAIIDLSILQNKIIFTKICGDSIDFWNLENGKNIMRICGETNSHVKYSWNSDQSFLLTWEDNCSFIRKYNCLKKGEDQENF